MLGMQGSCLNMMVCVGSKWEAWLKQLSSVLRIAKADTPLQKHLDSGEHLQAWRVTKTKTCVSDFFPQYAFQSISLGRSLVFLPFI